MDDTYPFDKHSASEDISFEEEEVFFGAISEKESQKIKKLSGRKTEHYFIDHDENISISYREELVEPSTDASDLKLNELPILSGEECQSQLLAIVNEVGAKAYNSEEFLKLQNSVDKISLNPICISYEEKFPDRSFNLESNFVNKSENAVIQLMTNHSTFQDQENFSNSLVDPTVIENQPKEMGDIALLDTIVVSRKINIVNNDSDCNVPVVNGELNKESETFSFTNSYFIHRNEGFDTPCSTNQNVTSCSVFQNFACMENNLDADFQKLEKESVTYSNMENETFCANMPAPDSNIATKCNEERFESTKHKFTIDSASNSNSENIFYDSGPKQKLSLDFKDDPVLNLTCLENSNLSYKCQSDLIAECSTHSLQELSRESDCLNNISDENNLSNKELQTSIFFEPQTDKVKCNQPGDLNLSNLDASENKVDYTKTLSLNEVNTPDNEAGAYSTIPSICIRPSMLHKSRESYFSSLDVINIDNDVMFQNFIIDERVGSLDSSLENSSKIKCTVDCGKNICDDYEKTKKLNYLDTTRSTCMSGSNITVEDSTDDGSKNYALLHSDTSKNISSPQSNTGKAGLQYFHGSLSDEGKVSRDSSIQSLDNQFNDTIEEMEQLLKYGDKYFQESKETFVVPYKDESILSPSKKLSVASAESASSFVPNLDSTRTSSDLNTHHQILKQNGKMQITPNSAPLLNRSLVDICSKKEPPPKPPRIMQTPSAVPHSLKKLNNEDITIKINCLPNNTSKDSCSTPVVNKVTKVHAPLCLSSKLTKQISSSTGSLNHHGTPINKTLKPKASISTSTPHSKHVFNPNNLLNVASIENWNSCYTPKNIEANNMKSYSSVSRTVKAERVGFKISQKPFLTPQGRAAMQFSGRGSLRKQDSMHTYSRQKVRGLNIVSPVAKYLQDNPPPPLIATVKPKNRPMISPINTQKIPISTKSWNKSGENTLRMHSTPKNLDASMLQRDETIEKMNDNMRKLTLKVNSRNCASSNMLVSKSEDSCSPARVIGEFKNKVILPSSVYIPGKVHKLENKENYDQSRKLPSDKPPNEILKHKGRIQVPKPVVFQPLTNNDSTTSKLCLGYDNIHDSNSSGRVSLMEVSVFETASVHHTNTLRRHF